MPALTLRPGGSLAALPNRVWIDTDAACGTGPRVHPDDCLAALALREDARIHVISDVTVLGNAPAQTTQRVTGALVQRINGHRAKPVRAFGESAAASSDTPTPIEDAARRIMARLRHRVIASLRHRAIASALLKGTLTLVALGPLTTVAAAAGHASALQQNVTGVDAVIGRRARHRFHPSESSSSGAVAFGPGAVFSDFNFVSDPLAVQRVTG